MNRYTLILITMLASLWPTLAGAAPKDASLYAAIRMQLRSSHVTVLLPTPIPREIGRIRSIAVLAAGRSGYYVAFSPVAHCAGGLSCAFFHVSGSPATVGSERPDRAARPIRLADGSRGMYKARDCSGASCTEASLTFARGHSSYEIDVKSRSDDLHTLENAYRLLRVLR